ncbi:unnamed protein product [Callosobruchus maculatus]|uniref:Uncharacterized protein n=1 Tax=Callosobruchus maculatus TaxID=64391 RepID=A0A653D4E1_CALMS|nr:unnamed protein product [Callosobruchus maculatus]
MSRDMFNDSIDLTEKGLKELGNTLKEWNVGNMVEESVNLIESSVVDISSTQQNVFKVPEPIKRKPVVLRSGKHWRRSLSVFKNTSLISEDGLHDDCLSERETDRRRRDRGRGRERDTERETERKREAETGLFY